MSETVLKAEDETKLDRVFDDTVYMKVHRSIKDAHAKALAGTYTELYRMLEQTVAKEINSGGAEDQMIKTRSESWPSPKTSRSI